MVGVRRSLKRAKEVVERFFPVVGILERMNESLFVMERILPR